MYTPCPTCYLRVQSSFQFYKDGLGFGEVTGLLDLFLFPMWPHNKSLS